jgi:hypothetical protein
MRFWFALWILVVSFPVSGIHAQQARGTLIVNVQSQSQAVALAEVVLELPAGPVTVTIESPGFLSQAIMATISVDSRTRIDVELQIETLRHVLQPPHLRALPPSRRRDREAVGRHGRLRTHSVYRRNRSRGFIRSGPTGRPRGRTGMERFGGHRMGQFAIRTERDDIRLVDQESGENLGNTRQTRYEPLVRPQRHFDGRWTLDAWSPLERRAINGGIRVGF